jgi:hypothetical protein
MSSETHFGLPMPSRLSNRGFVTDAFPLPALFLSCRLRHSDDEIGVFSLLIHSEVLKLDERFALLASIENYFHIAGYWPGTELSNHPVGQYEQRYSASQCWAARREACELQVVFKPARMRALVAALAVFLNPRSHVRVVLQRQLVLVLLLHRAGIFGI